jgi:hypothetical protein
LNLIGGVLAALFVVGFFGALIYVCLFKAHLSNMPNAARGVGLGLLAGAIKVVCLVLAERVSPAFNAPWINVALIVMAVVGFFVMAAGLSKGPR